MKNITEKRKEELMQMQKQLNELNDSIQKIIDGKSSMTEFANTLGISPNKLNQCVNVDLYTLMRRVNILSNSDIEELLRNSSSPTEKLINAIFDSENNLIILDIAEEDKVLDIMSEALTQRQYEIVKLKFGFNCKAKTLQEISKQYGVTATAIGDDLRKALRMMRNPKYLKMLLPDYDLKIKELKETDTMMDIAVSFNGIMAESIGTLGLSTRAYNALHRAKINTIGELSKFTIYDLMKLRNLGAVSIKEVTDKLKEFNISLKEY